MKRSALIFGLFLATPVVAQELPIFDAHMHYSHDAVIAVPPEQAVKLMRDAGLKKALISSSDDDGTQKLLAAAPDLVVPALRPYRRRGEIGTWMHDATVIDYLEDRLSKYTYKAIGEFHAYNDDIETDVIQRMIELAKEYNLLLHAHSDADAVDRIFKTWPEAKVLWAHSGFAGPEDVMPMFEKYDNLWADLAFRSDHARGGEVDTDWREAFEEFPERFMVGTDTYTPERWYYVKPHAEYSREWLNQLPRDVAENIAYKNAERMLESLDQ